MVVDPACGVEIDPAAAVTSLEYDGQTYYFCSEGCRERFQTSPADFLKTAHPHLISIGGLVTQRLPFRDEHGEFELEVAQPDDLSVGDRSIFHKRLTDGDIQKFAEASGDTNALHLNTAFAERTRFGRRIVHGTLVSGTISAALAALPGLTIYLSQNLEFERPIDIGTKVTATCEIVEELEDDQFRLTTRVANEQDQIAVHGTATVLIDPLPQMDTDDSVDA